VRLYRKGEGPPPEPPKGKDPPTELLSEPPKSKQIELPTRKLKVVEKDDKLPEAPEIEKAVLSLALQHPDEVFLAFDQIGRDSFFATQARGWFTQMRRFYRDKGYFDVLTFLQVMLDNPTQFEPIGGRVYWGELQGVIPPLEMLTFYLSELRERYIRRQIIVRSFAQASRAQHGDLDEVLGDVARSTDDLLRVAAGSNGVKPLQPSDLLELSGKPDPNNLVGWRWLCRGGNCLWSGGAGYGKSTLATQFAIYWATGERCFGVRPVRPLKSLIIQSENDDFDVSEQYNGVLSGIQLDDENRALVDKNVTFVRVEAKSGHAFLIELERLLNLMRPDLVWIDPLFAFAGCDLMNAEKTGWFLREGLFPMFTKFNCCGNIVHHIAKPPKEEKADKPVIDYQYAAFGSSEIQNAFRAVNTLHPISFAEQIYKLVFSKRGRRARAKTLDGNLTSQLYIQQSDDPGAIYWTQVEEPEKPTKKSNAMKYTTDHILGFMSVATGWKTSKLQKHIREEAGMASSTFYELWNDLKTAEKIRVDQEGLWFRK
jgi:Replicative DNA helicase